MNDWSQGCGVDRGLGARLPAPYVAPQGVALLAGGRNGQGWVTWLRPRSDLGLTGVLSHLPRPLEYSPRFGFHVKLDVPSGFL